MDKRVNLNTVILAVMGILISITGFFLKHTLDNIEHNMIPRSEIELQIQSIHAAQTRTDFEITEFRAKLTQIEISVARISKTQ